MTSSHEPPGRPAGQRGRRPPTIDLKATEVADESAKAEEGTAEPARPRLAWLPPSLWPVVAAGAGGIALTLAALALSGAFSKREGGTIVVDTRLARVEQQLRDFAAKPLPVASDSKAVDDLGGRVARLEAAAGTPAPPATDPALANRVATLAGDLKALAERVGVLGRRDDEIASIAGEARTRADAAAASLVELKKMQPPAAPVIERAEIEALAGRIAALERSAKAMEAQLGARVGGDASSERALRALVVAGTLNAAVERGAPFAAELAAAKAAARDPKELAPLEPFAKSGVPSSAALARELAALVPALAKATGTASRDTGILDRLVANAEKIVRISPVDETASDDPAAVVRRIEMRAEQGDLAGAMAALAKLPPPARALTKEWAARVEGRNAALDASRRFAAGALASIGKPSL